MIHVSITAVVNRGRMAKLKAKTINAHLYIASDNKLQDECICITKFFINKIISLLTSLQELPEN